MPTAPYTVVGPGFALSPGFKAPLPEPDRALILATHAAEVQRIDEWRRDVLRARARGDASHLAELRAAISQAGLVREFHPDEFHVTPRAASPSSTPSPTRTAAPAAPPAAPPPPRPAASPAPAPTRKTPPAPISKGPDMVLARIVNGALKAAQRSPAALRSSKRGACHRRIEGRRAFRCRGDAAHDSQRRERRRERSREVQAGPRGGLEGHGFLDLRREVQARATQAVLEHAQKRRRNTDRRGECLAADRSTAHGDAEQVGALRLPRTHAVGRPRGHAERSPVAHSLRKPPKTARQSRS
jgi:hypothetical protein